MGFGESGVWVRRGGVIVLHPGEPQTAEGEQGEIPDVIRQISEMWRAQPKEVQTAIIRALLHLFAATRQEVMGLLYPVAGLVVRGVPLAEAARRVGVQRGLRPRTVPKRGPTRGQVTQYHKRQLARGRRPGIESRLQRR